MNMTMLSRSGIHAVRALVRLSNDPTRYCGAQTVAAATGAPRNYLGKLLQQLSRRGIVQSQKGLGGGFRLARDPGDITLYEIIAPLEDLGRLGQCILGHDMCNPEAPCPMHTRWASVRESYLDMLNQTTLADLQSAPLPDALRGVTGEADPDPPRARAGARRRGAESPQREP
jgi:Rrf2 family protein